MSRIYTSPDQLIGHTPLVELSHLESEDAQDTKTLAKVEHFNPSGSVKDRIARQMIEDAEKEGLLKEGSTIIEPTSGNTGIGLAAVAAAKGYPVIIVLSESMSKERRQLIKAYGAKLELTPASQGMKGAIARAEELAKEIPGSFIPSQFSNPSNPKAHYETTGPEIWDDTDGHVDFFVAGVDTGGTISGTGRYLKEKNPDLKVIAVEPAGSPVLAGGKPGPHKIQGIGAGFIPETLDRDIYDELIEVTNEEAFDAARELAAKEGLLTGISSGAALHAAKLIASRKENKGKTIVVLLPDSGDRYLSTDLYPAA
ncbi:cysteine synthase A [Allobaculum mucilyticum]|uniref:cysteine synthase A n=1 Tax=Allobaculum mucilyticum TaxID=2834459 RepID=UPI001E53B6B2|nr:cysteine synthase A [Allobaculum mucilyticum]UNT95607.1 cysteine synthase A [Allobaculum mucilyticum]